MIIISVSDSEPDAIEIVKTWLADKGYLSQEVKIKRTSECVWAVLQEGYKVR